MPDKNVTMPDKTVTITKTGVIQIPWGDAQFLVNSDMIMSELKEKICALNPKRDHNGNFAGRVTIAVELFGDLEEDDNGKTETVPELWKERENAECMLQANQ